MTSLYRQENSLAARSTECARLSAKHAGMVPLVIERSGKKDKCNFSVVSPDATVDTLEKIVRDVANLKNGKAVIIAIDGMTPARTATLADLYATCKSEDGFLYVCYTGEKRLGGDDQKGGAGPGCTFKT